MTKSEMFAFNETTPMGSYYPSKELSYVGSLESRCDNGYGYYNYEPTKKGNNAKVMLNSNHYDAMCSPYTLNPELMVCSVYNDKNKLEFYGFMPQKC